MPLNFDDTPLRDPIGRGAKSHSKTTKARGYYAPPGTGPKGETCGTCKHACDFGRYKKCGKARSKWTGGRGTDILVRSPACSAWEKEG